MEFQPFRGCCEIFMDYHYYAPEMAQTVIDELGLRWVEPARIVASYVQSGLILTRRDQEKELMAEVAEAARAVKPPLKRLISPREIQKAEGLFRTMGIFPKTRGDSSYNPSLARRGFLKPFKTSR